MQRLHEEDVSGQILSSEWSDDWAHLCIPMQYEAQRHCVTVLGWEDPRGLDKDGKSLLDGGVPRDTAAQLELEEREGISPTAPHKPSTICAWRGVRDPQTMQSKNFVKLYTRWLVPHP